MKGFKLTEKGDISITDGQIDMIADAELEKQTMQTVLSTNKGESPFNAEEGINHRQILGKNITKDMIQTQIQSGLFQVNPNMTINEFDCRIHDRQADVRFTVQESGSKSIAAEVIIK